MTENKEPWAGIFDDVRERMKEFGIQMDEICSQDLDKSHFKVICVPPGLADSVREMGRSIRDQVVMVRIDEDSSKSLDDWVEAGAVKSRSEAAALFIREGLKVRSSELEKLKDALNDVDDAKQRLRDQAKNIFGSDKPKEEETTEPEA